MASTQELHAEALSDAHRMVVAVLTNASDLDSPSACAGWTVRDLVSHMTGQNLGFARAISAGDAPAEAFTARPAGQWAESVEALRRAVAEPAATVVLAEVRPGVPLPLDVVLGVHTLDLAVHAWDVAGARYRPSLPLAQAVLAWAQHVPGERPPGGPFAPALPGVEPHPWHTALRLLGRRPDHTDR